MTPIQRFIDNAFAEQERRYSDIIAAGEQIRRWREEEEIADCLNGQPKEGASK